MGALGDPSRHFFVAPFPPADPTLCLTCRRPETAHPKRPENSTEALKFFGGTIGGYPT